jgi:DNA-binding CsgD family transcriptional regulator
MTKFQKIKNILLLSPDINALCLDFMKKGNLSYFCYTQVNTNGYFLALTTHPAWTQNFYEKKLYNIGVDSVQPSQDKHESLEKIVWEFSEKTAGHQMILSDLRQYGIYNLYSIIKYGKKECQIYHFGTAKDDISLNQLYIHQPEQFEIFIYYFQDQLHKNKQAQNLSKLFLPFDKEILNQNGNSLPQHHTQTNLIPPVYRYYLEDNLYVTEREIECIHWTSEGKTAIEIGQALGISHRTVETHLNNLRQKLNCEKNTQILRILNDYQIYPEKILKGAQYV